MQGVERFTKMLLAEGEAARHRVCCGVDPEVKVRALDVNHSNSDAEGTASDRENGEGESGIEEPELAPCSSSANGEDDGSQSDGGGSGSEGPDAATPSEENGGGGTDNERSVMPVCRYFRGEYGCKKGSLCDYRHEWGSDNGEGRCWNCGSTKHLKKNCPANGAHQGNPKMRAAIEVAGGEHGGGS